MRRLTFIAISLAAVMAFPQAASAGNPAPSAAESEFVGLLNQERAKHGLSAVAISPSLTGISDDYVAENVAQGGINHNRDAPYTARAGKAGCTGWSGPTLAKGYPDPAQVLQVWLGSPQHREILLDPRSTHTGPAFQGEYAVAYVLDCSPARNTSGAPAPAPFGLSNLSAGDVGTALRVSSKRPRARGRTISTSVRIRAGKGTLGLAATSGRRAARGRRVSVKKRARSYRVAVKVSRPGRWKVSLRVNGRVARRFTVRVRASR